MVVLCWVIAIPNALVVSLSVIPPIKDNTDVPAVEAIGVLSSSQTVVVWVGVLAVNTGASLLPLIVMVTSWLRLLIRFSPLAGLTPELSVTLIL